MQDMLIQCYPAGAAQGANGEVIKVDSGEKREKSVYIRGHIDAVTQALMEFLGGVE